jgi:lysophospholipase L1-like esterase
MTGGDTNKGAFMLRIVRHTVTLAVLACLASGFAWSGENNAIVPVPKLENDSYDWYARHKEVLKVKDAINPEIVMIGDSITHFWGGEPPPPHKNGAKVWDDFFGKKRVLNMGFGWDRTQNVLWRLDNGEFEGLHPKYVVLHIGTNNFSGTKNARESTPPEVAEGIKEICARINTKSPDTKIILMAVFPRGASPKDGFRPKIAALNELLAVFAKEKNITYLDIGPKMLQPDGTLPRDIMGDSVHPTEKGYAIWTAALKEVIKD